MKKGMMSGIDILMSEAKEFVKVGSAINIVNPQSNTESFAGKYLVVEGERKIDLTRLDYLGLGSNQAVRELMIDSIRGCDISCPASQVVMKSQPTVELERAIAELHGMKETIVFTSGYAANENLMLALSSRMNSLHLLSYFHDTGMGRSTRKMRTIFFVDGDSHYSLQLSLKLGKASGRNGCLVNKFPTMDYETLRSQLEQSMELGEAVRIIVSDTLCSSTGRIVDVKRLCDLSEEYQCLLYLDEAHSIGALGPQGRGVACAFSEIERHRERLLIMGTLTKVFCQLGGYVTLPDQMLSWYLRICCPQYIFSAPVPPWMAQVLVKIIEMVKGNLGEIERGKLHNASSLMRGELNKRGFNTLGSNSHIIPVAVGDELLAAKVKAHMEDCGFVVALFEHPAVAKGNALVRFSICSDITEEEVVRAVLSLVQAREKYKF